MEAHDCTVPHISHSLSGALNVAKPDLAQKYLKMVYSICLILLAVQDRGLAKVFQTEKFTKFTFTLSKSKLSGAPCNIIELWKAKHKHNDPFSKVTFSTASIFVMTNKLKKWTEILLTRWSCYSFAPVFFQFNHFIACLWRKSAINNESHFPFNHRQIQSANKRDNPLFSLMSPCIAMVERKKKLAGAQLI